MSTVWFSLKKSFHCKSDSSDVINPKSKTKTTHLTTILTRKRHQWGCSRSIKDVINGGSKRHHDNPVNCSPRSIGSSEFLNPITHEVILNNASKCELKISTFSNGLHDSGGEYVGTLMPGTPGPGGGIKGVEMGHLGKNGNGLVKSRRSLEKEKEKDCGGFSGGGVTCHKCGKVFRKWENLEAHHLSKHAVTELIEGDSSRKIVEIICRSSWLKSDNNSGRIEKILKVHNMQKTLARFEEYRELVKTKASKLPKKHPRCLADGNELLRFYGATITCSLGINGVSSLCVSDKCCVCRIIRDGFSTKREELKGGIGVFTSSTSARAFESIEVFEENPDTRKALIVCRVIAGRVHRPLENIQEMAGQSGFDSLAGKVGLYSNIEELYLLSPRALLPCFVEQ
ncbi:zinc finger protein [Artemisia annua]|uniref:Zinc finger protein n=1 Tax=Artemisia annua TaxID=35608 RepID=A0A2U1MC02_ARTAN|nr:zinc finger protein [Artemisia annua]